MRNGNWSTMDKLILLLDSKLRWESKQLTSTLYSVDQAQKYGMNYMCSNYSSNATIPFSLLENIFVELSSHSLKSLKFNMLMMTKIKSDNDKNYMIRDIRIFL